MPKTQQEYVLTEKEIETLFQESLRKYKDVIGDCHRINRHLLKELDISEEGKQLMHETGQRIINGKKQQKKSVLDNKLERVGFQIIDPYYIAGLKPISPLIYKAFFQAGVTSNKLQTQFNIHAVNEGFEELGGNSHYRFKKKFYAHGKSYKKRLKRKGILKKFPDHDVPSSDTPASKFLPMSWMTDYLDKMRSTAKENGYMELIQDG